MKLHLLALQLLALTFSVAGEIDFHDHVKPLLAVHCVKCHGAEEAKGGLRLNAAEAALRGGESGAVIVPSAAAQSELIKRISSHEVDEQMPPKGARLTVSEISTLRQWIDEGAKWPTEDRYWAFQPLREMEVPAGTEAHPIDRFIGARLASDGISPVPLADARTLLRRAFFNLLGMPPTPEETSVLLKLPFSQQVDKLLADSRYGERWARHWLDVVRYAESNGYEDDKLRPQAWRYRDYVIRALNDDKPYDRFVQEQIAGDELWPEEPDAWIATGFARLGAWDGMSKEPEKQRQDFLNDATDAVGAAFLGMTLGCARCHDHKYDAISQRDYYAMQAFFAGAQRETPTMNVPPVEPEFVTKAYRLDHAELTKLRQERESLWAASKKALETPDKKKIEDDAVREQAEKSHPGQLDKLDAAIKPLEARIQFHEPKAEAVTGGAGKIHLLKGGELSRRGDEIAPGFITAMTRANEPAAEPKRTALARWLTKSEHPLTARVMVNRVWQHHFGIGLVATPSDFGRNGQRPTHPELLDWLAAEFIRSGWSVKHLHRIIMTSAAYQRASTVNDSALAKDPQDKLYWRYRRQRLEGEAIRDTILSVSGTLNPAMGGPGVYAKLPQGINVEFPNNDKELSWGTGSEADDRRRSIYLFQRRTLTFPLLEVFDSAPMNQSCAARPQTTVAPQALALFNGEFAREQAGHFAQSLTREIGDNPSQQIERAYERAFTRKPEASEREEALKFLATQTVLRQNNAVAALTDFCHALLNSNELIFVD